MLTVELLHRLRGAASASQLKRWRQQGLFPAWACEVMPMAGGGKEVHWHESSLERARVIVQALQQGDPLIKTAAKALFTAGYEIRADWLRRFLLEVPDEMRLELGKWRDKRYLKQRMSNKTKRERLTDLVCRSLKNPSADVTAMYVAILAAVAEIPPDDPESLEAKVGAVLSPSALQRAIDKTPDAELVTLFHQGKEFDLVAVAYSHVMMILRPFLGSAECRFLTPITGHPDTTFQVVYENMRLGLLWRVVFKQHGFGIAHDLTSMIRDTWNEALRQAATAPVGGLHAL